MLKNIFVCKNCQVPNALPSFDTSREEFALARGSMSPNKTVAKKSKAQIRALVSLFVCIKRQQKSGYLHIEEMACLQLRVL